jgi:universal stress protein A
MAAYKKLLILLDLSSDSEKVFMRGLELAAHSDAAITALHVIEYTPVETMDESLMPTLSIERDLAKRSIERMDELIARLGAANARSRAEIGNTKAEILRVAEEERADLIVLGSRERHGLAILVNFTEDTVLHAAHCDVLAVRLS